MKTQQLYKFDAAELEFYESRLPPAEVFMARQRLAGKSLQQTADFMGCTSPNVARRLRILDRRLQTFRALPVVEMARLQQDLLPLFQDVIYFDMLVMFIRCYPIEHIQRKLFPKMRPMAVSRLLLETFHELSKKVIHPKPPIKSKFTPQYYALAMRALWDKRQVLMRPTEKRTYQIGKSNAESKEAEKRPVAT